MADLRRSPGQRFNPKAADWNAFVDAARYVKDRAHGQGTRAGITDPGTIVVKNVSVYSIPRYGMLWVVGGPWTGIVTVTRPELPVARSLALAAEPIGAGAPGHVWMDGIHPCRVQDWDHVVPGNAISCASGSFDGRVDALGRALVVEKLDAPLVMVLLRDNPAAPKIIENEDGTVLGAFRHVVFGSEFDVTDETAGMPTINVAGA